MKKVIYIIAMALCLSSCCSMGEIERKKSEVKIEYLDLKGVSTLDVFRFEYDGHIYPVHIRRIKEWLCTRP